MQENAKENGTLDKQELLTLLEQVKQGTVTPEDALLQLRMEPFQDLGYAKIDHHRGIRQGVAEVIYGAGKSPEQIAGILSAMKEKGNKTILITRMAPEAARFVEKTYALTYHPVPRIGIIGKIPAPDGQGDIVVATGGTSDIPVAEEAALTAEVLGNRVERLYDVGVAGLHRLLSKLEIIIRPWRISRRSSIVFLFRKR